MRYDIKQLLLSLLICSTLISCASIEKERVGPEEILIFGASGRIGGQLTKEALLRGYKVTGVSRSPDKLKTIFPSITSVQGDILDRSRLPELLNDQKTILVSVGGSPTSPDPEKYIAYQAAISLIEVLGEMGNSGPRVIFVGNLYTLKTESGESLLERAKQHKNYPMFAGHQLALEAFRNSSGMSWSIASPPNGFRLKDRIEQVRFGTDTLLLNLDGEPASISLADYAYGVFEEINNNNFINKRFTLAR